MQDYHKLQGLLLQWHKHYGIRSIEQIRMACSNLLSSFRYETKHSLFKVFYPLLRKGLIEFHGNSKYQVAPPAILYYKKEHIAVGINLPVELKDNLIRLGESNEDIFETVRIKLEEPAIRKFCEENECNYSEPDISGILSNFPKIADLVNKFEHASISSAGEFYDVFKHHWSRDLQKASGVFRLSDNAHKYYLRTEEVDLQIPDSKFNPEGRPLAESYQVVIENREFLTYSKVNKVLTVKDVNIPILIERILRMASLFRPDRVKEEYGKMEFKNIPLSTIKQLNRIFSTKIKIDK